MASRLRLIQATFADDPPDVRHTYIAEALELSLKEVAPGKRQACLAALAEKFPSWQPARTSEEDVPKPAPAPVSPETLLARLIEAAPDLSPEARAEFARKLQAAGFGVAMPASTPFSQLSLDLRKQLGLPPDKPLNAERAVKMLAGLLEMVLALDQLVWALWRQLARQSRFQKDLDFGKLAGPYLTGDPEVPSQLVGQPLERTRRLLAALLGAGGRAGSIYARTHGSRFAPEVIEDWAKMEKKWNESLEFACWRKYRELYKEHCSEPSIENEIQEGVVKATENLILGRVTG